MSKWFIVAYLSIVNTWVLIVIIDFIDKDLWGLGTRIGEVEPSLVLF